MNASRDPFLDIDAALDPAIDAAVAAAIPDILASLYILDPSLPRDERDEIIDEIRDALRDWGRLWAAREIAIAMPPAEPEILDDPEYQGTLASIKMKRAVGLDVTGDDILDIGRAGLASIRRAREARRPWYQRLWRKVRP